MLLSFIVGVLATEKAVTEKMTHGFEQDLEAQSQNLINLMILYCETDGTFEMQDEQYICKNVQDLIDKSSSNNAEQLGYIL